MMRVLVPLLLVAALAGCTTAGQPVAEPSPTSTQATSAMPTEAPTPEPSGPPALDDLVIEDGGINGFVIGTDPLVQDPSTAFMAPTGTDCEGPAYWEDVYPVYPFGEQNATSTIRAVTDGDGLVGALEVNGPGPRTSSGLGVGSSRAKLLDDYPQSVLVASHIGRDRYAIDFGSWVLAVDVVAPGGESMNPGTPVDTVRSLLIVSALEFVGRPSFHTLGC